MAYSDFFFEDIFSSNEQEILSVITALDCIEKIDGNFYREVGSKVPFDMSSEGVKNRLKYLKKYNSDDDAFRFYINGALNASENTNYLMYLFSEDEKTIFVYTPFLMALKLGDYDLLRKLIKKGYLPERGYVIRGRLVKKKGKKYVKYDSTINEYEYPIRIAMEEEKTPKDIWDVIIENTNEIMPSIFFDNSRDLKKSVGMAIRLFDMDMPDELKKGFFGIGRLGAANNGAKNSLNMTLAKIELYLKIAERIKDDAHKMLLLLNSAISLSYPNYYDTRQMELFYEKYYDYKRRLLDFCGDNNRLKEVWLYGTINELVGENEGGFWNYDKLNDCLEKLSKLAREYEIPISDERFISGYPGYYIKGPDRVKFEVSGRTRINNSRIGLFNALAGHKVKLITSCATFKAIFEEINNRSILGEENYKKIVTFYIDDLLNNISSFSGNPISGKSREEAYKKLLGILFKIEDEDVIEKAIRKNLIIADTVGVAMKTALENKRYQYIPILMATKNTDIAKSGIGREAG